MGIINRRNHIRIAQSYAKRVSTGKQIVGEEVRQAVARYYGDMDSGEWDFDHAAARRACRFIELLPHIKGKWAREKLKLELAPWQCFIVINLFGWKSKETGLRRFRTAYIEVARKNGKTTLAAGIALYMLASDNEPGAEVYCGAKTSAQAREVFDAARKMMTLSGADRQLGCRVEAHSIHGPDGVGKFQPVASESDALDGKSPHCIITDELHAHKTPDVYNALDLGTGSREQPLHISITTAGENRAGICWSIRSKTVRILQGLNKEDEHFGIIYRATEEDDPALMRTWKKANPNLSVSMSVANFRTARRKAHDTPSLYAAWLTKRLNIWVGSGEPWLRPGAWEAAGQDINPHDFIGADGWQAVIGVDLSAKVDLCAVSVLFFKGKEIGVPVAEGHDFKPTVNEYRVFSQSFVPAERARERADDGYPAFIERGEVIATAGDVIDRAEVDKFVYELAADTGALQIGFDPWDATASVQAFQKAGLNSVIVPQRVSNLSPAMKELEAALLDGRLFHEGDTCLAWQMGAVTARIDERGNLYPKKEDRRNARLRIDAPLSVLICFVQILSGFAEPEAWEGGVLLHSLYSDDEVGDGQVH